MPSMLLQMQRTAGNQAVNQLIRGYKAGKASLPLQRSLNALLSAPLVHPLSPVQRAGGKGAVEEAEEQEQEQDQDVEPDAFDAVVAQAKGEVVPEGAPGGGAQEGEEEQAQQQEAEAREVLSPLEGGISQDQPHVAKVVLRELARNDDGGGEGGPAPSPQQGGGVQAPGDPVHLAQLKKASLERVGKAGEIAASLANNEKAGKEGASRASRRGITGLINTVVSKANMLLGLAPKATALLAMVAKVGAAVQSAMQIIQAVATPVGLALGVVQSWLDLRSLVSSLAKWRRLNKLATKTLEQAKVLQDAEQARAKGELAGAIKYAASQKGEKSAKRLISFVGGAAGVSAGVIGGAALLGVALAATPIGWALAGVGAVVGLGMLIYKIYRWNKKRKAKTLGVDRKRNAEILYKALKAGDPDAITAVRDDLDIPLKAALSTKGLALIERKLKSS